MRRRFLYQHWLHSAFTLGLARGIVCGATGAGLMLCGPYFCIASGAYPRQLPLALSVTGNITPDIAGYSTPELVIAFARFLSGEATPVIGSSEIADPHHMAGQIRSCAGTAEFLLPHPGGNVYFRTALLLERLGPHIPPNTPLRLLIIDNSHYASNAGNRWQRLQSDLVHPVHLHEHRLRYPHSLLGDSTAPEAPQWKRSNWLALRRLEWQSLRLMLGRRFVRPLRQLSLPATPTGNAKNPTAGSRNTLWQVDARFVPPPERMAEYRQRKAMPDDFSASPYARSVRALAHYLRTALPRHSQVQVQVLLLPPHRRYHAQLGFAPARIDGMLAARRAVLETGFTGLPVSFRRADTLRDGKLFYDSIHYTATGRRQLAHEVCRSLALSE